MKVLNPLWTGHRQATAKALPQTATVEAPTLPAEELFVRSERVEKFQDIRANVARRGKMLKAAAGAGAFLATVSLPFAPPEYRTVLGLTALVGVGFVAKELLDGKPPQTPEAGQRTELVKSYREATHPGTPPDRRRQLFAELEAVVAEADLETGQTQGQVGGMNQVRLWTGDDGLTLVTKAYSGEKSGEFRNNIESGGQYGRERASYIVDRWLGHLAGTPPTVAGAEGLRTLYVPGGKSGLEDPANNWILSHPEEPGYRALAIFDNVIGNLDRHRRNYLILEDGQLVPIDHGLSFPTKNENQGGHHHEFDDWVVLNEDEKTRLTRFNQNRGRITQELSPHLPAEAIEAMFERVDTMLKLGRTCGEWRRD